MTAIATRAQRPRNAWATEARAMLALASPMILTNLGQTAMQATDVMMMGHIGPQALAAGTLGANLYAAPMFFGLGLMQATSPMIAANSAATAIRCATCAARCARAFGLPSASACRSG